MNAKGKQGGIVLILLKRRRDFAFRTERERKKKRGQRGIGVNKLNRTVFYDGRKVQEVVVGQGSRDAEGRKSNGGKIVDVEGKKESGGVGPV